MPAASCRQCKRFDRAAWEVCWLSKQSALQASKGQFFVETSDLLSKKGGIESYDENNPTHIDDVPTLGEAGSATANTTSAGVVCKYTPPPVYGPQVL